MFEQSQVQEFKEVAGRGARVGGPGARPLLIPLPSPTLLQAFSCIDQNRDGIITKADLKETYWQLGQRVLRGNRDQDRDGDSASEGGQ